jgi:hypothetical protein
MFRGLMFLRLIPAMLALGTMCFADTITLKNGGVIEGTYLGGDARRVKIAVGDRIDSYSVDELQNIQFGRGSARSRDDRSYSRGPDGLERRTDSGAPPSAPQQIPQPGRYDNPPPPERPEYNPPASSNPSYSNRDSGRSYSSSSVVPAGTSLVVRLIDAVDSQNDHMGQTYRASIDEPVVVDGQTVIPRGADVIAKLVEDKQSGKLEGRTVLTLDLMQVQVNGRMVDVNTTDVSEQSGSRGARTGKVVGGTAALGAIIGALAGGGKGAAIGAASGAAVGTGAQVMTKGQRVRIPSETRLTFILQQPLQA